jgi:hypothetical protein
MYRPESLQSNSGLNSPKIGSLSPSGGLTEVLGLMHRPESLQSNSGLNSPKIGSLSPSMGLTEVFGLYAST